MLAVVNTYCRFAGLYTTVEAAKAGRMQISLKGKFREILLPGKLCKKLLKYAHTDG